jgi:IS66 C-terminal element
VRKRSRKTFKGGPPNRAQRIGPGCSPAPIAAVRAALLYSLIVIAKLNDVDPQASLADVPAHTAAHPANRLDELLP